MLALSFGLEGRAAADRWFAQAGSSVRRRHVATDEADEVALRILRGHLRSAKIGLRILIAGPQTQVHSATAVAMAEGLIGEEIAQAVTNHQEKNVYCPHCRTTTVTEQCVGNVVECVGCSRSLEIYHHFSRRTASYLGFMNDAEAIL